LRRPNFVFLNGSVFLMQFVLTKDLLFELWQWIADGNDTAIESTLAEAHEADLAELLNKLRHEEAIYIYKLLDKERAAKVMLKLDEDVRKKLLSGLTSRKIAEDLIKNIDSDDADDVILELPEKKQEEVIALLKDEEQASNIINLMTYKEGTAGALMGTDMVVVYHNWNVAHAIWEMQKQAEHIKNVYSIYVVDEKDGLLGTLSMKTLIFASSSMPTTILDFYKQMKVRTLKVNHLLAELPLMIFLT
jgi:magnesium transporter